MTITVPLVAGPGAARGTAGTGSATACGTASTGPAASSSATVARAALRIRPVIRSPVAGATARSGRGERKQGERARPGSGPSVGAAGLSRAPLRVWVRQACGQVTVASHRPRER
ncbi:hypothetical protein GCM10009759_33660 [Kitasatospora saccharophila]|uniref:Uncharacterized protein n=1 Tax=Kitasatospora saccharophila TaxID=407973 RepID=A0ABN2WWT2_9ACTN